MEQADRSTRNNHINRHEKMGPHRLKINAAGIIGALVLAMTTINSWVPRRIQRPDGRIAIANPPGSLMSRRSGYRWERDFPMHLQARQPNGKTDIILEFSLTDDEQAAFFEDIKSRLNGTLPVRFSFSHDNFDISIAKQGKGQTTLNRKSARITNFIAKKSNLVIFRPLGLPALPIVLLPNFLRKNSVPWKTIRRTWRLSTR